MCVCIWYVCAIVSFASAVPQFPHVSAVATIQAWHLTGTIRITWLMALKTSPGHGIGVLFNQRPRSSLGVSTVNPTLARNGMNPQSGYGITGRLNSDCGDLPQLSWNCFERMGASEHVFVIHLSMFCFKKSGVPLPPKTLRRTKNGYMVHWSETFQKSTSLPGKSICLFQHSQITGRVQARRESVAVDHQTLCCKHINHSQLPSGNLT